VPIGLVGKSLAAADKQIVAHHLEYQQVEKTEATFGIVDEEDWIVCETKPSEGEHVTGNVKLIAAHYNC
jgi:hypothetical protein